MKWRTRTLGLVMAGACTFSLAYTPAAWSQSPAPGPSDAGKSTEQKAVPQGTATATSASLTQVLNWVVTEHPAVLAAKDRYMAAGQQYQGAQMQVLPTLSVDTGQSSTGGSISTVSLTQPVYAFGKISASIDAAEVRADAAQSAVNETALQYQEQTLAAYYEFLRTRDRLRVAKDNLAAHEKLAAMMQRRAEGGVGSESDLSLARTRVVQTRNELLSAESVHRKARSSLSSLINRNPTDLVDTVRLNALPQALDTLVEQAFVYSPTAVRLKQEAQAMNHDAKSAFGAAMPQIVVRAEQIEQNFGVAFKQNRVITALQFQPGAGFSAYNAAKAAEFRATAADKEVDRAARELTDKVNGLYADMQNSSQQAEVLQGLKKSNADLVQSFYRQFQASKRSWLDVLNAQREAAQSEYGYVDAYYGQQSSVRRLLLITGKGDQIGGVPLVGDLPTKPSLLDNIVPLELLEKLQLPKLKDMIQKSLRSPRVDEPQTESAGTGKEEESR